MIVSLMKLLGFYMHRADKPFRVYYNASRFPNEQVAKLYNAVVYVYIKDTLSEAAVVNYFNPEDVIATKENMITFEFEKLSFLNNESSACIRMNREAEKMMLKYEKEMYDKRRDELKDLYGFFDTFRPDIKSHQEINELIDFIRSRLTSWAEFELAKMLPIWLHWFGQVSTDRFYNWYHSHYFEKYLMPINDVEQPTITKIFDQYITASSHEVDFNYVAALN